MLEKIYTKIMQSEKVISLRTSDHFKRGYLIFNVLNNLYKHVFALMCILMFFQVFFDISD